MKRILIIFSIITIILIGALAYFIFIFPKHGLIDATNAVKEVINSNLSVTETPEPPEVLVDKYKFENAIAWIASFDYQNGKNDFYKHIDKFTEVSPTFYDLTEEGTVSSRSVAGDKDLVSIAHKNQVKVTPTIISFSENAVEKMLTDSTKYKQHIDFLVSETVKYGYDGLDLDYESINLPQKDLYLNMIKDLSTEMHLRGKTLSVTVIAKDKDFGFDTLTETRATQDWTIIGNYADQIRIMAYDYSSESTPGPVSPYWWLKKVMEYGLSKTSPEKLILGQPLYAYAYGTKRYAYTYDEIAEIIKAQNLNPEWDAYINEKILRFKKGDEERVIWYQDKDTMHRRFYLIDRYKISGFAFWRLGGEDEGIYDFLSNS